MLVTLGLYALVGFEFNLTTIAAFLTLIGYSVNDTVVIFDRVRENMRKRAGRPLIETAQREPQPDAVADPADRRHDDPAPARALLFWAARCSRGFAFVMFVGIIVGTYSSIYIASPFALLWEQWFGRARAASAAADAASAARPRAAARFAR